MATYKLQLIHPINFTGSSRAAQLRISKDLYATLRDEWRSDLPVTVDKTFNDIGGKKRTFHIVVPLSNVAGVFEDEMDEDES
ncbi:MAG: hypothetical protein M3N13_05340 [Candidatus Eremiobacteraeota bacterium]|nr:hypothetical protein [Candidatus Eremiobacteraeota bacterium]